MAGNILANKTGLRVVTKKTRDNEYRLSLYAKKIHLGFTTVTEKINGGFIIGGCHAGCFMNSGDDDSLQKMVTTEFSKLEDLVNEEAKEAANV